MQNPFGRAERAVTLGTTTASGVSRGSFSLPSGATIAQLPSEIALAFGINSQSSMVSRLDAMSIPAMRRARNIIVGTIATLPLVAIRTNPDGTIERLDRPL